MAGIVPNEKMTPFLEEAVLSLHPAPALYYDVHKPELCQIWRLHSPQPRILSSRSTSFSILYFFHALGGACASSGFFTQSY